MEIIEVMVSPEITEIMEIASPEIMKLQKQIMRNYGTDGNSRNKKYYWNYEKYGKSGNIESRKNEWKLWKLCELSNIQMMEIANPENTEIMEN